VKLITIIKYINFEYIILIPSIFWWRFVTSHCE